MQHDQTWTDVTWMREWNLTETDSIKKLMKNMNWTIDQAMNALEVPEDKREKYRQVNCSKQLMDKSTAILTYHRSIWRYFSSYLYCKIISYWYC